MAIPHTLASERDVIAVFPDRDSADCAFRLVTEHGYEPYEVDVMMSETTRDAPYPAAEQPAPVPIETSRAAQGAGVGGAVGGAVGAVAAALVAAGSAFALPGLGVVVAGPLAGLLAGGAAGGLTGGLIGALIGWGVPEQAAPQASEGVQAGGIVLRVRPHNAEDAAAIGERWRGLRAHLVQA